MRIASIGILAILTHFTELIAGVGNPAGSIIGSVRSAQTMKPLSSVNVTLEGTTLGTTTNEKGEFLLLSVPVGLYSLLGRMVGYEDARVEGVLVEEGSRTLAELVLNESAIRFDEIRVTADRNRHEQDLRLGTLSIAPARAKAFPGVGEDVFRVLQSLPGVMASSDNSSQLIIRGGGPEQNLVVMDNIEVFNPYRLFGFISMFNPETVSDITLLNAGFPARYGNRLSAVVSVTNREGNRATPLAINANVSITNAGLVLDGRTPFELNGSYLISARRTYYDLVVGPIARSKGLVSGDVALPNFSDLQTRFALEPWANHSFVFNGLTSRDFMNIVPGPEHDERDSIAQRNDIRNDLLGLSWHFDPSHRVASRVTVSWYRTTGDADQEGTILDPSLSNLGEINLNDTLAVRFFHVESNRSFEYRKVTVDGDVSVHTDHHVLAAGGGIDLLRPSITIHYRPDQELLRLLRSQGIPIIEGFSQTASYTHSFAFLQDKFIASDLITLQAGIRLEHYGINGKTHIDPRLNVSFTFDPVTTLSAAFGTYHQSPGYERIIDQNIFFDLSDARERGVKSERAEHYVLGVTKQFDQLLTLKAEGYIKSYSNLMVQEIIPGIDYEALPIPGGDIRRSSGWTQPFVVAGDSITQHPVNSGRGKAYGIEILLEKRLSAGDRLSGWIGYSFGKSTRTQNGVATPFRFDRRHTIDVVLDYQATDWLAFGMHWRYGSAFPYTPPLSIKPRVVEVEVNGQTQLLIQTDTRGNVLFDIDFGKEQNKYAARLPDYHRLDIRITARADYWGYDWSFYLDIINAYNRNNVLGYRFSIDDNLTVRRNSLEMLPIVPTLGVSVKF